MTRNQKIGQNMLIIAAVLALAGALIPWENKGTIGRILFGVQSLLLFTQVYIQYRDRVKQGKNENKDGESIL